MSTQGSQAVGDDSEDQLPGLYPANIIDTSEDSIYPPNVDRVLVHEPQDGYYDVTLIDASGDIVATGNRARYRIEAALEGQEGYDIVTFS